VFALDAQAKTALPPPCHAAPAGLIVLSIIGKQKVNIRN
jgi:hypothetical protein